MTNVYEIDDGTLAAVARTIKRVAVALKKALSADGVNIISNNDKAAGQVVFHLHFHVIPRFENDGFAHWPQKGPYKEGEVRRYAEKIRAKLT